MRERSDPSPKHVEILIGNTLLTATAHAERRNNTGAWTLVSYRHGRTTTLDWTFNPRIRPPLKAQPAIAHTFTPERRTTTSKALGGRPRWRGSDRVGRWSGMTNAGNWGARVVYIPSWDEPRSIEARLHLLRRTKPLVCAGQVREDAWNQATKRLLRSAPTSSDLRRYQLEDFTCVVGLAGFEPATP